MEIRKPRVTKQHTTALENIIQKTQLQIDIIKKDWHEIEQLIFQYKTVKEQPVVDLNEMVRLDNLIQEKTQEYAKAKIYIQLK